MSTEEGVSKYTLFSLFLLALVTCDRRAGESVVGLDDVLEVGVGILEGIETGDKVMLQDYLSQHKDLNLDSYFQKDFEVDCQIVVLTIRPLLKDIFRADRSAGLDGALGLWKNHS